MNIETPAGTINQITPIREFVELTTITNSQYLLGIQNISTGNGSKITFGNLITSLISGDANNKLVKGSDDKLFISTPIEIGTLEDLTTSDKTDLVSAINELNSNMGSLSNLETTVKTSLVAAINSVAELTEPELLIDKVNQSKALVTGNVAGYLEELEQLKMMKRTTFDRSKFTKVGSPTITNDGIASGIDKTNYLETNVTYADIKNKSWTFKTRAYVDHTNVVFILFDNSYPTLGSVIYSYGIKFCAKFGDSTESTSEIYVASLGVVPVGWYDISLNFDINTGTYTLWAKNIDTNAEYTNNYTPTVANKQLYILNTKSESTVFRISTTISNYTQTIDLKHFSITVDGVEVFSGNKTGIDTIKPDDYTVIPASNSTVSITSDGIASGFGNSGSTANALTVPFSVSPDFQEIVIELSKSANATGMLFSTTNQKLLVWQTAANKLQVQWRRTADTTSIFDHEYTVDANATYYKIKIAPSTLDLTADSTVFNTVPITTSDVDTSFTSVYLGVYSSSGGIAYTGSMDLNKVKIYVDGNLIYQPCLKIPYYESSVQYGSKIVDVQYRERVLDVYQQGYKDYKYYTLDEVNGNFTLPHGEIYGMLEQIRTENEQNNEAVRQIVDVKDNLYKILEGNQSTNKALWDLITFTDNSEADNLLIGGDSPFTSNSSNPNFHFYLLNSIIGTNQPDDTAKLNIYKLFNKSHYDVQSDPIYVQDGTIVIACASPTKLSKILLRSYDTYYTTPSIIHIHGANITNNMSRDITMTDFTSYAKYIGGVSTTKEDTYTTPTNTNWGINRPIELTIDDKDTFNTFFISMSHWCSGQSGWSRRLVGVQVYGTQMANDNSGYTVKMSGDYENCKWIASNGKIYNTDDLYQQYGYIPKEKVELSRWISCFGSGIGQANATTRAADQYYPKYISGTISTTKNNGGQPWYFLRQTNYSAEPRPQVGYNVSGVGYLEISSTLNNQTVIDYTADSSFPIGEYYWEGTFGYNNSPTAHDGNTYMCGWCQLQKVYDDDSVEIIQTFSKEGSMYEPSVCYRTPRFYANRAFKKLRLIIKEMAFPNAAMIVSQMQLYYRDTAGNIARSFIPNPTQYDLSYNTVKHKSNVHFFITPTGVRVGSNCFIEKTNPITKAACVGNRWINENTKKSYVCNTSGIWTEEDFCEIGCMTMFGSKHKGMRLRTVANSENPMQKYIQDYGDMGGNLALDYPLAVNASTVVTSSPTDPDFYFQAESKDENEGVEFSLPANTKTLQSYRRSLVKSKVYQGGQQFAHWSNCDHTGAILKAYKTFDTSAAGEYIEGSEEEQQ